MRWMHYVGNGLPYGAFETVPCCGYDTIYGIGDAHQLAVDELCTAVCKLKTDIKNE